MKRSTDFQKSLTKQAKEVILQKAEENHRRVYGTCAGCNKIKEAGETWYQIGDSDYQACSLPCKWDVEARLGYRPIDTFA